jgi:non-canonical (house-cleaning) NTP pyrophosphatase
MNVVVASKNPVKIRAATEAFSAVFPGKSIDIRGARR